MTFEELKEILERYGFEVEKRGFGFYVFYKKKSVTYLYSKKSRIFLPDDFYNLSNTKKALVLRVLARYIEGLPEKKYKYKIPKFLWVDDWDGLFRYKNDDRFFIEYGEFFDDYDVRGPFTDAEIEDLIEDYGKEFKEFLDMCEKVEVQE